MKVPLLDLRAQYKSIQGEIEEAVCGVLRSQQLVLGSVVSDCENAVAAYSRCAHGVGVSSGTDALLVSLMAENIGPGDEVITTPYSFFATAGCISRCGAKPVFADIRADTFAIDADLVEERITKNTRAIIPVHLFGQCAAMDPILRIAEMHGLTVIEDAAQAIGAEYRGRRAGSMGEYGCFSFYPTKNLGAAGDGGMVVTGDSDRAERLSCLRSHGAKPKYYHGLIGGNFRLDALQAAVVSVKLRHLNAWTAARQRNASIYIAAFEAAGLNDDDRIVPPSVTEERHIFNQFVIRSPRRDKLRAFLSNRGIGTEIYYPLPLHLQNCFSDLGFGIGAYPKAERAAAQSLALPIYPELEESQIEYVVDTIKLFF
jgi:dTDP-4-amino-4,6-dideoxygalactose transaminase